MPPSLRRTVIGIKRRVPFHAILLPQRKSEAGTGPVVASCHPLGLEPIIMTSPSTAKLAEPRIVQGPALVVAGLRSHFSFQNLGGLPALWQRFAALRARIPDQVGGVTYGVGYNIGLSGFDYIAGV